jgi:hypothetical protein
MERFQAGDIDGAELGRLADELRRQQEVSERSVPTLPDVPDITKAWVKLTLEQKRLVIGAATESLTIQPCAAKGRMPGFDERRIAWVPVS